MIKPLLGLPSLSLKEIIFYMLALLLGECKYRQ